MSAYPAEVLAREGLKDLRVQFLAKPFTRDELLSAVQRALAASASAAASTPGRPGGRSPSAAHSRPSAPRAELERRLHQIPHHREARPRPRGRPAPESPTSSGGSQPLALSSSAASSLRLWSGFERHRLIAMLPPATRVPDMQSTGDRAGRCRSVSIDHGARDPRQVQVGQHQAKASAAAAGSARARPCRSRPARHPCPEARAGAWLAAATPHRHRPAVPACRRSVRSPHPFVASRPMSEAESAGRWRIRSAAPVTASLCPCSFRPRPW